MFLTSEEFLVQRTSLEKEVTGTEFSLGHFHEASKTKATKTQIILRNKSPKPPNTSSKTIL